jgi:hypothetical protein
MTAVENAEPVQVSVRALIQRINRKIRPEYRRLHACRRNSRWWSNLGDYYVVDTYRNMIVDSGIDPTAYGRRLGVLQPFEEVVEDDRTEPNV